MTDTNNAFWREVFLFLMFLIQAGVTIFVIQSAGQFFNTIFG